MINERKTDPPHLASLFFYSTKRDLGHFFWHYGISFSREEMFEKYSKINWWNWRAVSEKYRLLVLDQPKPMVCWHVDSL